MARIILCSKCSNVAVKGKKSCEDCLEKSRIASKKRRYVLKDAAFKAYGGYRCNCPGCFVTEPQFLTIDHIDNDGAAHRREHNIRGSAFYRWLFKENYPDGFQVLCYNCNSGKGINGGTCPRFGKPHSKEK